MTLSHSVYCRGLGVTILPMSIDANRRQRTGCHSCSRETPPTPQPQAASPALRCRRGPAGHGAPARGGLSRLASGRRQCCGPGPRLHVPFGIRNAGSSLGEASGRTADAAVAHAADSLAAVGSTTSPASGSVGMDLVGSTRPDRRVCPSWRAAGTTHQHLSLRDLARRGRLGWVLRRLLCIAHGRATIENLAARVARAADGAGGGRVGVGPASTHSWAKARRPALTIRPRHVR